MDNYTEKLAEKIKSGQQIIIYGAGMEGESIVYELQHSYNIKPVCICDGDAKKWGKILIGISIISIQEALKAYPDAKIFIASSLHKYQIIGYLLYTVHLESSKIINYEPVEKRRSCSLLETQMLVSEHKLQFCCSDFGKKRSPAVEFNGDYESSVKNFCKLREEYIECFNHSQPTACDGCLCLEENYFAVNRIVERVNYSEGGICNSKCTYCSSCAKTNKDIDTEIYLPNLMDTLSQHHLINEELVTFLACGEVSIHPLRKEIYQSVCDYRNYVCTNAFVYDKDLAKLLSKQRSVLHVSVDSGTNQTFKKIKGFDLFDQVKANLKKYSQDGLVELKYIFLPGVNDNVADIDGFFGLFKEINACSMTISFDLHASHILSDQTRDMVLYFVNKAAKGTFVYKNVSEVVNQILDESGQK
jgi:hypothetical protein